MKLAILCPLYKRVEKLPVLIESIETTVPEATLYVRASEQTPAVREDCYVWWEKGSYGYAQGINRLAELAASDGAELLFVGADDLRFHEGWLEAALAKMDAGTMVVGTNDLGNPRTFDGEHATHMLVRAEYLGAGLADGSPGLMCEAYHHNYVDDELCATAKARGVWAHAADSIVEHLHPNFGKAEMDETYARGPMSNVDADAALFARRERLWRR